MAGFVLVVGVSPRVDHDPAERRRPCEGCGVRGDVDGGTARSLRTAQWTRASL
jgi:hypothetical protein